MRESFDNVADIYDETRKMPAEAVARIMKNILDEVDPSSGIVLDLGIGTGRIAVPLAEKGFRITGVDIAEKMLGRLQEKITVAQGSIRCVYGDLAALPFADGSFGAAIAVHVLHLLDDIHASVREAHRVLVPNGVLLFGGEQRMLRRVSEALPERYDVEEDITATLADAGIRSPDQAEVERQVMDSVRGIGGELKRLPSVTWQHEISCEDFVARIKNRVWSSLWAVPDDVLKNLVERLQEQLAAHVGPPSTMIPFHRRFDMYCARF